MKRQNKHQNDLQQSTNKPLRLAQAVRRGGQLYPFFSRLGPVTLSICSVLLISLMAILYLSQLGQAVATNQQIQDLHSRQTDLQRQNSDLINTIAGEQSPAYIAEHASQEGLEPADPQNIQVIVIPNVAAQQNGDGSGQP